MDSDGVMAWVARYERAWRDGDTGAVEQLFTEGATYRASPYEPSKVGHDAIKDDWVDPEPFTMSAAPVAVDGPMAVVRVEVHYGEPERQEYRDLWVLRFADDGRVDDFEEWAYWPGRTYSADH